MVFPNFWFSKLRLQAAGLALSTIMIITYMYNKLSSGNAHLYLSIKNKFHKNLKNIINTSFKTNNIYVVWCAICTLTLQHPFVSGQLLLAHFLYAPICHTAISCISPQTFSKLPSIPKGSVSIKQSIKYIKLLVYYTNQIKNFWS